MGEPSDDLHGDSGSQDAHREELNPRQGFFVEHYDNKLRHACQVWLRFQVDGETKNNWCVWEEDYTEETAGRVRGQQEMFLLLFRQIAHTLNSGVDPHELWAIFALFPSDMPSVHLPEPWFYWASSFDYEEADETAPTCTHYFVQPNSAQCLVWQEDSYMEIVSCESVGLHWQEAQEAVAADFEEAADAQEEDPTPV